MLGGPGTHQSTRARDFDRCPLASVNSNDQHCYLRYLDGADLRVGDLFAFDKF